MKYILSICMISIFCITSAESNIFVYDYKYQVDSTDVYSKKNDVLYLLADHQKSIFFSIASRIRDSVQSNRPNSSFNFRNLPPKGVNFAIAKDKSQGHTTFLRSFGSFKFAVDAKIDLDWEIVDEEQDYLGYNCRVAKTKYAGREYIALFTEEIPISDGPYVFKGLPGLILHIKDSKNYHVFDLKEIKKNEYFNFTNTSFNDYKKVSQEEFAQFQDKLENNPMLLADPNGNIKQTAEMKMRIRARVLERKRRLNNPIELD